MNSDPTAQRDIPSCMWRPSAKLKTLQQRATLLRAIRQFFDARAVLEVETPVLSQHATVDRHIESFHTAQGAWLQTSPEFAMKRLLCAGSGAIWQLCKVFRREEAGRHHNPEFSLLEWYQPGYDHHRLMNEVEELMRHCGVSAVEPFQRLSYRDAFVQHVGFDPLRASCAEMSEAATRFSPPPPDGMGEVRDAWLDHFYGSVVSPRLGLQQPCFIYDFPASQAALSRVRGEVAERFELVWRGVELANGFHELADADEQARRFAAERAARAEQGKTQPPADAHLIAALHAGLPDCAGVALGVDRLLMLLLGQPELASTLAFDWPRA